jgi:hypothetical protein
MAIECKAAFERLMEADPAELAGSGDTELAVHVRECARCTAVAARLIEGQQDLAGALDELAPRTGVEEALSIARARRRRAARRRAAWRWAAPLAAAAAVTAVVLARGPGGGPMMPGEIAALPAARIEPLVEVSEGQNVMVFETRDKSAKVIWFY